MPLDLTINSQTVHAINESFDRIAHELMNERILISGNEEYRLTEIEFYYFHEGIHEDRAAHEHSTPMGHWRAHRNGIDLSLGFSDAEQWDGGILLRGIERLSDNSYINGPQRVWFELIAQWYDCETINQKFGLKKSDKKGYSIHRTTRQGLTTARNPLNEAPYRFYRDSQSFQQYSKTELEALK